MFMTSNMEKAEVVRWCVVWSEGGQNREYFIKNLSSVIKTPTSGQVSPVSATVNVNSWMNHWMITIAKENKKEGQTRVKLNFIKSFRDFTWTRSRGRGRPGWPGTAPSSSSSPSSGSVWASATSGGSHTSVNKMVEVSERRPCKVS